MKKQMKKAFLIALAGIALSGNQVQASYDYPKAIIAGAMSAVCTLYSSSLGIKSIVGLMLKLSSPEKVNNFLSTNNVFSTIIDTNQKMKILCLMLNQRIFTNTLKAGFFGYGAYYAHKKAKQYYSQAQNTQNTKTT